jgi:hypothetical protein
MNLARPQDSWSRLKKKERKKERRKTREPKTTSYISL